MSSLGASTGAAAPPPAEVLAVGSALPCLFCFLAMNCVDRVLHGHMRCSHVSNVGDTCVGVIIFTTTTPAMHAPDMFVAIVAEHLSD